MKLQIESQQLEDYLKEIPNLIEFHSPLVSEKIKAIQAKTSNKKEQAELAFKIARDEIAHSFDSQNLRVSISAEETLKNKDGICFAKAHLLAALLRGLEIPTGFCYQRVLKKGNIESGYALHGLNAVYLKEIGWFRVDPRGNKEGINSQFTTDVEQLAYPIRKELGEIDYLKVLTNPLPSVITAMKNSANTQELFDKRPESL